MRTRFFFLSNKKAALFEWLFCANQRGDKISISLDYCLISKIACQYFTAVKQKAPALVLFEIAGLFVFSTILLSYILSTLSRGRQKRGGVPHFFDKIFF